MPPTALRRIKSGNRPMSPGDFGAGLLLHVEVSGQWGVLRGVANEDCELAGIDAPVVRSDIPVGQRPLVERECYVLRNSRLDVDLLISLQFLHGTLDLCRGI